MKIGGLHGSGRHLLGCGKGFAESLRDLKSKRVGWSTRRGWIPGYPTPKTKRWINK